MLLFEHTLWIVLLAILLDAVIGDPDWLWSRFPHPVTLLGKFISYMDRTYNKPEYPRSMRKTNGVFALVALILCAAFAGVFLQAVLSYLPFADVLIALVGMTLIAQKSLYQHVARVRDALRNSGLTEARKQVSMIVGRNPDYLDEAGVSRAAIESCSENFSDGVVAPIFWFAVLGLPGLFMYKAVNTADSMIGHKNETYQDFGWASARLMISSTCPPRGSPAFSLCWQRWFHDAPTKPPQQPSSKKQKTTAPPTQAGQKLQWRAHWVWHWQAHANMQNTAWKTLS